MSRFTAELVTDIGQMRDHNEDYALVRTVHHPHGTFHLWIVADGMGGGARGEVASQLAAQTVADYISRCEWDEPEEALRTAFEQANAAVYAEGTGDGSASRSQMGTTLVVALVDDASGEIVVANVGDSRAYLVRGNDIRQLTRDHSLVAERLAASLMTEEEARNGDERNIITRAIGTDPSVIVDVMPCGSLGPGMRFLLCSDGLHGLVPDEEILREVATNSLYRSARALVRDANAAGGRDNITVLVAGLGGPEARAPLVLPGQFRAAPTVKRVRRLPRTGLVVAALASALGLFLVAFAIFQLTRGGNASSSGQAASAVGPALQSPISRSQTVASPSPALTGTSSPAATPSETAPMVPPDPATPTPTQTAEPTQTVSAHTPTSGESPPSLPAVQLTTPTLKSGNACDLRLGIDVTTSEPVYIYLGTRRGGLIVPIGQAISVEDGTSNVELPADLTVSRGTTVTIEVFVITKKSGHPLSDGSKMAGSASVSKFGQCTVTWNSA